MNDRQKSYNFLIQNLSKESLEYPQELAGKLTRERESKTVRKEWIAIGAAIKKLRYANQPFIKLVSQIVAAMPKFVEQSYRENGNTMRECMLATADYLRDNMHLQGNKAFRQKAADKLFALFAFAA